MMLRVTALMFLAVVAATPAAAQPARGGQHDQSIGGGPQWALPFSGEGDKPGVQTSWRRWFSARVGVGTDFRWASRNTMEEFNLPGQERSQGVVIPSAQILVDQRIASYGFGVAALAKRAIGRLSFIAGAGPGFFVERRSRETRADGRRDSGRSTLSSFGLHMLVEVDVRATGRLSAFIGLRDELRDLRHLESRFGYPTAGVRFAF